MPGGTRSPYRPPCGYAIDDPEKYWLGGPWQHYRSGESAIAKIKNTTAIANYADPAGMGYTATIAPYTRPTLEANPDCGCAESHDSPCYTIPCGPWPEPVPANTYAADSGTLNVATCRKLGFKNVYARKAWHGILGFLWKDGCCTPVPDTDPACCSHPVITTVPDTHYRTLTFSFSATRYYQPVAGGIIDKSIYTINGTCSIDRYTGKYTISGITNDREDLVIFGGVTESDNHVTPDGSDAQFPVLEAEVLRRCVAAVTSGHYDDVSSDPFVVASGLYDTPSGNLEVTVSDSSYTRTFTGDNVSDAGGDIHFNYTFSSTLSDDYTSDMLNADANTLLGYWDLSNDIQYPWRTDLNCTRGPLMSYFEKPPTAPFFSVNSGDVDASPCDGSVLGAPAANGTEKSFDFRVALYADLGDGCAAVSGYGDWNPGYLPNATQWTDDLDAAVFYPGAFAAYNVFSVPGAFCGGGPYYHGYLIKSKYAEVITLSQPSHDFKRPCGPKDADTIDQTTIVCDGHGGYTSHGSYRWIGYPNPCATDKWNDNTVKGDWCLLDWTFNYRDVGENARIIAGGTGDDSGLALCEADAGLAVLRPITGPWSGITCTQYCSTFVPCCPASVFITPNGETATNATVINTDNTTGYKLACDDFYGSKWQTIVKQWMTDPLWQPPARPCDLDGGIAWTEDDGSGQADTDTIRYYPQRTYEECRCALPVIGGETAPALPSDCYIGCLSVANINASAAGNICSPPVAGQCYMPVWLWAANRAANILASGRFSCDYADPMAVCTDDPEIDPP